MRGLVFDPGETTGYASFSDSPHDIAAGDFPHFSAVRELLQKVDPDIVIIESFRLYPWKAKAKTWSSFPEIEVIGAIKHECFQMGLNYIEQGASDKNMFDDEKLKALGFWRNMSPHARDSCRHALYYMTTEGDYHWLNSL